LEQNKYQRQKLEYDTAKVQLAEAKEMIASLEAENAPLNDQKKYEVWIHINRLVTDEGTC
jgi:hypothetical protein